MRLALVLLALLLPVHAWAVYNDSTVVQVDPVSPQDTIAITAQFTGPSEPAVTRTVVMPWNYTDDALAEWSAGTIEKLNGAKTLPMRIKPGDKLPITRPIKPESPNP